jgi:hypothetical protein
MKRSIIKSLVLVVLVLVFALSFVSPSEAQKTPKPVVLKGTYGVIGEDICVAHWTTAPGGGSTTYWTKTSTMQGTAIFYTDGTGTAEVNQVTITHPIYTPIPIGPYFLRDPWPQPPGSLPLGSITTSHISTAFTYKIDPLTRSISRTITNGSGTFISGSGLDGKTYTFTGFDTLGYVSLDTQTIIGASPVYNPLGGLENPIMSVTIYNEDNSIYGVQDEMCQRVRSSVLIK